MNEGGEVAETWTKEDQERYTELVDEIKDSTLELDFEEDDFIALTVLCHLKENAEKYFIHNDILAQKVFSCLIVYGIMNSLLICMYYAMLYDEHEHKEYDPNYALSFPVWFVKFPCCLALHFVLYPEVATGMSIMKFSNN